jgi:hypothetical protein
MTPQIKKLVSSMDEHNWCRMLVCFTPGLVLGKLSSQFGLAGVGKAGSVILAAGVVVYLVWPKVRQLLERDVGSDESDEPDTEAAVVPTPEAPVKPQGAVHKMGVDFSLMMAELVQLCGGSSDEALALINTELAIDSSLLYTEALDRALRRARHVIKPS